MPPSVEIGALIIGGILLLMAVSAGAFKIFGSEMSVAFNNWARVFGGIVGLGLIIFVLAIEIAPKLRGKSEIDNQKIDQTHESDNRPDDETSQSQNASFGTSGPDNGYSANSENEIDPVGNIAVSSYAGSLPPPPPPSSEVPTPVTNGSIYPWLKYGIFDCQKTGFQIISCHGNIQATEEHDLYALYKNTGGLRANWLVRYNFSNAVFEDGSEGAITRFSINGHTNPNGQLHLNLLVKVRYDLNFSVEGGRGNDNVLRKIVISFLADRNNPSNMLLNDIPVKQ